MVSFDTTAVRLRMSCNRSVALRFFWVIDSSLRQPFYQKTSLGEYLHENNQGSRYLLTIMKIHAPRNNPPRRLT